MQTEEQKVQELLKPRVIVENKWPGCDFEVGEILEEMPEADGYFNSEGHGLCKVDVIPYPYLMRPLHWYEERDASDMPEYVKDEVTGKVLKIEYIPGSHTASDVKTWNEDEPPFWNILQDLTPATLADYQSFNDKKEKV